MAILKFKDADGNIQEVTAIIGPPGPQGDSYVLTESDKQEMVNAVLAALPDGDEVYY